MYRVNDKRSMKIVVTCHCVLNQNSKLEGIAGWPGSINQILKLIMDSNCGILQIPCPEMLYEGIRRFDKSIEQYDCPAFREVCKRIAVEIVDQMENYLKWDYQVPAIIAIDGSPSCGLNLTQTAPEWRGLVAEQNWKKVRYKPEPGIFIEILKQEMSSRNLDVPIVGIPEIPELGSLDEALNKIKKILS